MKQVRAKVKITGRVQGVWFRQSTKQTAVQCGVTGWVRNCPDNSVEAIFEGDKNSIEMIIQWCKKGPQLARVNNVEVTWEVGINEFPTFTVR